MQKQALKTAIVLKNYLFTFTIAVVSFLWLSKLLMKGKLEEFDNNFLTALPEVLPENFIYFAKFFYFLGNAEVSALVVLTSLIILASQRRWVEARVVAFSSLGVLLLMDKILKPFFFRRRPLGRLVDVDGRSFPSGHATGNIMLYFLLIYIFCAKFPQARLPLYILSFLILLMMGIASVYLRVHWITDILAGYCVGFILYTIALFYLKLSE